MRKPERNNFSYLFGGLLLLFLLPPSLRLYFGTAIEEDVTRVIIVFIVLLFTAVKLYPTVAE